MAKLQRIGVILLARLTAIAFAIVGMAAGLIYAIGGAIADALAGGLNAGSALAFLAIPGMPLIGAAFGFMSGAVAAILYNRAAKRFGGFDADVDLG